MAEKKYIEREKLPKRKEYWDDDFGAGWDACLDAIDSIPAADVRPVVLCRDCKCYQQSHYIDNHMECARSGFPVHSVDFCSLGEKREES